jgi:putative ABC transport system permease protein
MGLVAGVLSLGVLALRNVLERRRAIGVLRALGYQPRSILTGILIEATLITALAIAMGLAAGTGAVLFILEANSRVGPTQAVDMPEVIASLAPIYGGLLAVTLAVSIGPALRASRLDPVEALRLVD